IIAPRISAGGAEYGELVQLCERIRPGRLWRHDGRHDNRRGRWLFSRSECNRFEDAAMAGRAEPSVRGYNVERPLRLGSRWWIADRRITGLISEMDRDNEVPRRCSLSHPEANTDREFSFEDCKRLILAELRQVGRWRVDDLVHTDAVGRLRRQLGLDETRITRAVRLDMKSLGETDV